MFSPFRISLFGGGTDFEEYYIQYPSKLLGFATKFGCWVTINELTSDHNKRIRLVYSKIEETDRIDNIQTPLIRESLRQSGLKCVELHYNADLGSRSGLGTSSAFANALNLGLGLAEQNTAYDIAMSSIRMEREILEEAGGIQDQIISSYGGLVKIDMNQFGWQATSNLEEQYIHYLQEHICLVPVPEERIGTSATIQEKSASDNELLARTRSQTREYANEGIDSFFNGRTKDVGKLIRETWEAKKMMSGVTNENINKIEDAIKDAGVSSFRLMGAGGGGYFMCWVDNQSILQFKSKISTTVLTPKVSMKGTHFIAK